jgi:hypothetical protein
MALATLWCNYNPNLRKICLNSIQLGLTVTDQPNWFKDNTALWSDSCVNSIKEINVKTYISIFPNPAINNMTIESSQKSLIEILNIQGQLIKTLEANEDKTNIDVSTLPSGVYLIKVETEKGIEVRKFLKD